MIPRYLDSEDLLPEMVHRPNGPFLVRPYFYSIIDGDTLRIRTDRMQDGKRHCAFRIRLCSIDTPELRKPSLFDPILQAGGLDPFRDGPGEMAREFLKRISRNRVLLISPQIDESGASARDRYGRMLAQVTASGIPGPIFRINGAYSVERKLFDAGLAQVLKGHDLPVMQPIILETITRTVQKLKQQDADHDATPAL